MTLVEILVGIVIIGVALVDLASVVPLSSYGIQTGNQVSQATVLTEQRLEQLRARRGPRDARVLLGLDAARAYEVRDLPLLLNGDDARERMKGSR